MQQDSGAGGLGPGGAPSSSDSSSSGSLGSSSSLGGVSSSSVGSSSSTANASSTGGDASNDPNVLPPGSVLAVKPINEADVRAYLAFSLAGIFAVTILIAFGLVSYQLGHSTAILDAAGKATAQTTPIWDPAKELIANLLSAEVGLFGTVLGFYFGGKAAQDKGGNG